MKREEFQHDSHDIRGIDRKLRALAEEIEEIEQKVGRCHCHKEFADLSRFISDSFGAQANNLQIISDQISALSTLVKRIADEIIPHPVRAIITQGDSMVTGRIVGLLPGASDTFFATPVDINGNGIALPAGTRIPTITSDDPTVTVSTAPDGLSAVVTSSPGATPDSAFNLNWETDITLPDGSTSHITGTASVPILTPVPPPLEPVGAVISQGAPAQ